MTTDAPRPPLNILLVEDHPVVARMMLDMLRRLGHQPAHAASVAAAADALRQSRFDAMVCDFSLPDGTAYDLARQLNSTLPPAILLSAYETDSMPTGDEEAQFAVTLEKPVDPAQLDQVLRRITAH